MKDGIGFDSRNIDPILSFVGCKVYTFDENGNVKYRFQVVRELPDNYYLLQAIAALDGWPNYCIVRHISWFLDKTISPWTNDKDEAQEFYNRRDTSKELRFV